MTHLDFSRLKQGFKREKEQQEVLDGTSRESNIEPRDESSRRNLSARDSTSTNLSDGSFHLNESEESNTDEKKDKKIEDEVKLCKRTIQLSPNKKIWPQRRARFCLNTNVQSTSNTCNIYSTTRRIRNKTGYFSGSSYQNGTFVRKLKQAKRKAWAFSSFNLCSASYCQMETMRNKRFLQEDSCLQEDRRILMRADNSSLYYNPNFKYNTNSKKLLNNAQDDEKIDRHPALVWTNQRCKFRSRSIDCIDDHQIQTSNQTTLRRNKIHSTADLMMFEDKPYELKSPNSKSKNIKWTQAKAMVERRKGLYKPNENAIMTKKKKEYRISTNRRCSPPPPSGFISPYGLLSPPPSSSTIPNLVAQSTSSLSQWSLKDIKREHSTFLSKTF